MKKTKLILTSLALFSLSSYGEQLTVNTNKNWTDVFPETSDLSDQLRVNSGATLEIEIEGTQQIGAFQVGYPSGNPETGIAGIVNFRSGTIEVGDFEIGNIIGGTLENPTPKGIFNLYTGATIKWTGQNNYDTNKRMIMSRQSYSVSEFNIDGGTLLIDAANGGLTMSGGLGSKSVLNISNGGAYRVTDSITSNFTMANGQNSSAEINISGKDSLGNSSTLEVAGIFKIGGDYDGAVATMTISDGGKLLTTSTANELSIGGYRDNVSTVYVNKGGLIDSSGSKGLNIKLGASQNSTAKLIFDGGEFINSASTSNQYLVVGNETGVDKGSSLVSLQNGAKILQTSNSNLQIKVLAGGEMEVLSGSKVFVSGNFSVGSAESENVSKLVLDGSASEIRGKTGGTSYTGSLYLANAANQKGETVVSDGASAIFRNIQVADKANSQGILVIKGLGSSVGVGNFGNNYNTNFGVNMSDSNNYAGSSAKLEIWTGATFYSQSNTSGTNPLKICDSGQVHFVMDSSTVLDASNSGQSMLNYFQINAYKSDGASNPFVIDASQLKATDYDGAYEIVLMEFSDGLYLNDEFVDFDSMSSEEIFSFIQDNFDFKNCTNIYGWEDIGAEDVYYSVNRLVLQLTSYAVPEPSTFALVFGTLALAFASYRKKRSKA